METIIIYIKILTVVIYASITLAWFGYQKIKRKHGDKR